MRITSVPLSRRLVFAVTGLLFVAACGKEVAPQAPRSESTPASAAPPPPPAEAPAAVAPAPTSLDEAEAQDKPREEALSAPAKRDELGEAVAELERARTELEGALSPRASRPAATAGAGASRGADADASRAPAAPAPKAEKKGSESSCSTACRAFTSLDRAASAVCRLAGEKDARCTHAHDVLADAQKRVTVCGCQAG
jgi:type IV secretory pathway VirB10-like protein